MGQLIRRDVFVIHCVVTALVEVRVRRGGLHGAIQIQRPVARVHLTAREWDLRLSRFALAWIQVRAVPVFRAQIVPVLIRVADATAYK